MKRLIGNKKFYRSVMRIAIPIMIQNGITNFVALLDNIMIGAVGTDQMSGVSIANQLIFVFYLAIFGAISGAGIFSAQFYGQSDHNGVRNVFRFKLVIAAIITLVGIIIFYLYGSDMIQLYLHDGSTTGNLEKTLEFGKQYLFIMLIGLVPFAIEQCYSGTLRETGETVLPMKAGIVAVFVNLILNYILIYGKFGAPELGVQGAAIATVIARFAEITIIVSWTHIHSVKNIFIQGVYRGFRIPVNLIKSIIIKGSPLLLNEFLWAAGMAFLSKCYSERGLAIVAGLNISITIGNLFNIIFIAIGSSVAIIVGQQLGAHKFAQAKETAFKIIFMSILFNIVIGIMLFIMAPLFPKLYNTSDEVRNLATMFLRITACVLPLQAAMHATYFTIRSGGKTLITFLFDSVFVWVITIPTAFLLTNYSGLDIMPIFFICQIVDIVKITIGFIMLKKEIWISDIVSDL